MKVLYPLSRRADLRLRGRCFSRVVLAAWIIWVLGSYHFPDYFGRFTPSSLFRDSYVTTREGDDFLANLYKARVQEPWEGAVARSSVAIDNRAMDTLNGHPPSEVSYRAKLNEPCALRFSVAMIPECWVKGGDGVLFKIVIQEEGGLETVVFCQYIDPKANEAERIWHDREIDLSRYRGKSVIVKFITESGPMGDAGWDWAVWGDPRLEVMESEEE